MNRTKYVTLWLLLITFNGAEANVLPQNLDHENQPYSLCKQYTLRYGLILKIAEIGWFSPNCVNDINPLMAPDKIIRFHYFKNVSADFFRQSAEEYFLLNLEEVDNKKELTEMLNKFNQGYSDIESGDYYDLVLSNNAEISLLKNKELQISLDNPAFSKKYFNIWFGQKPVIKKLKSAFMP